MDDFPRGLYSPSVRLRKGEKELNFAIEDLLVPRIAAAFSVQPPVYLIKDFDNTVIFPNENSGKFNPASLNPGGSYEVQGSDQPSTSPAMLTSPFGSYTFTRCSQASPLPHPPIPRSQKKIIKKTILIANLAACDTNKPTSSKSNQLVHSVVTSIIIALDSSMNECNVRTAAELVKRQVGFDVVLLDCRLFPLIECEMTSSPDFWKSTRKIVAASRSTYEKLVGVSVGEELSQVEDDDAVIEQPRKKRKTSEDGTTLKLQSIDEKLDQIDKKLSFIEELKKSFECVICRSFAKSPVVAVCCQRLIGCRECVQRWHQTNTRCPLCSVTGRMAESFCLKGLDDLLGVSNHSATSSISPVIDVEATSEDSANEFEEMPPFQAPRAS